MKGIRWHSKVCAATDNATNLKATGGYVTAISCSTSNATTSAYIKLYDKATAPTAGDTPVWRGRIQHLQGLNACLDDAEIPFSLGIGYRVVTGAADADTTAPTASEVVINIAYTAV